MNWRRGLSLAGINLAVALPMVALLAIKDTQLLRDRKPTSDTGDTASIASLPEFPASQSKEDSMQEAQTVSFSPCNLWGRPDVQESVVQAGNLPVALALSGVWRVPQNGRSRECWE
jgi:hypothetical protein